jgi:hypothetical protein
VNVIPFRRPKFYAFCFYEGGTNVIQEWFFRCGLEETAWPAFNSILDIYETGGVDAIRAGCVELERGFWGLKIAQASGMMPCVIFKLGPFDEETEITFWQSEHGKKVENGCAHSRRSDRQKRI